MPQLPRMPQLPGIAPRGNGGSPKKSHAFCESTATTATDCRFWMCGTRGICHHCHALKLVPTNVRPSLPSPGASMLRCSMPGPEHVSKHSLGRMRSVLTMRVLIVSVLIIGGRMMRVRRIEAPGRALAWSEMVRTPHNQFFFHKLSHAPKFGPDAKRHQVRCRCSHCRQSAIIPPHAPLRLPRPTRHRQRAESHA